MEQVKQAELVEPDRQVLQAAQVAQALQDRLEGQEVQVELGQPGILEIQVPPDLEAQLLPILRCRGWSSLPAEPSPDPLECPLSGSPWWLGVERAEELQAQLLEAVVEEGQQR